MFKKRCGSCDSIDFCDNYVHANTDFVPKLLRFDIGIAVTCLQYSLIRNQSIIWTFIIYILDSSRII